MENGYCFLFDIFYHIVNSSPSAGRVRGLKGSTRLSPVHALHFGLADWVSTPAPRQLSKNPQLSTLFTHALTLSTTGIRLRNETPTHLASNPRLSPALRATVGPQHHRDAAAWEARIFTCHVRNLSSAPRSMCVFVDNGGMVLWCLKGYVSRSGHRPRMRGVRADSDVGYDS